MRHFHSIDQRNRVYFLRIQLAIICSLLLFILLFRFWPKSDNGEATLDDRFSEQQITGPELIMTSPEMTVERIAPPVPRPEVTVPDDEVVDMEYDLDLGDLSSDEMMGPIANGEESEPEVVEQPDRPPRVRRIVEPVMPSRARRDGVRAEIVVLFVVSSEGKVVETAIDEIRIFNEEKGVFETVSETDYGFREITLRAARQWLFHPAEQRGEQVRARTRHQFTFGSGSE